MSLRRFPSALDRLRRRPVDLLKAVLDGVGGSASRTLEDLVRRVLGMDGGRRATGVDGKQRIGRREPDDSSAAVARVLLNAVAESMVYARQVLEMADAVAVLPSAVHPDILQAEHRRLLGGLDEDTDVIRDMGASAGAGAGAGDGSIYRRSELELESESGWQAGDSTTEAGMAPGGTPANASGGRRDEYPGTSSSTSS